MPSAIGWFTHQNQQLTCKQVITETLDSNFISLRLLLPPSSRTSLGNQPEQVKLHVRAVLWGVRRAFAISPDSRNLLNEIEIKPVNEKKMNSVLSEKQFSCYICRRCWCCYYHLPQGSQIAALATTFLQGEPNVDSV